MRNAGYWATRNAIRHPHPSWSSTMRHVAAVVAWHVGEDLTCKPSDAHLAELTGLSRSSIERALRDLEAAGVLRRRTGAYSRGGRKRVIEWTYSPLVPLTLVVDNGPRDRSRTVTHDGSEPSPMTVAEPSWVTDGTDH